jgi:hypothetical protein
MPSNSTATIKSAVAIGRRIKSDENPMGLRNRQWVAVASDRP